MKKILIVLLLCLSPFQIERATLPSLVAHTVFTGNANGGTSSAIETTGATLLVIHWAAQNSRASVLLSDSKANKWLGATENSVFPAATPFEDFACIGVPLNVGTGHTFTITGSSQFISFEVMAFNNIA